MWFWRLTGVLWRCAEWVKVKFSLCGLSLSMYASHMHTYWKWGREGRDWGGGWGRGKSGIKCEEEGVGCESRWVFHQRARRNQVQEERPVKVMRSKMHASSLKDIHSIDRRNCFFYVIRLQDSIIFKRVHTRVEEGEKMKGRLLMVTVNGKIGKGGAFHTRNMCNIFPP